MIIMEGVLINVMSKAKKSRAIRDLRGHNAQLGKATGNRDDKYKKYNFDVLEMQGLESVDNYNRYFKQHAHVGYNAHKEELKDGDFVVPRLHDSITKVESIIVAPPIKVLVKDIESFDFTEVQCFFDDYIHEFMKRDSKFKDVKILSAKVHCNEVYYPRFEETDEINPDGTRRLRRLSKEESKERAYIKVHMHVDYIPLVEAEKGGIKYLKLSSNDLWKAQKGKYFDSFREFNDRFYKSIGASYGLDRGQKWEEWDVRVQKKNNGELVKENRKLSDFQMDQDEEYTRRYIEQLQEDIKTASEQSKKKLEEELRQLEEESAKKYEKIKTALDKRLEDKRTEHKKDMKKIEETSKKEIEEYQKAIDEAQAKALDKIVEEARAVITQKKAEIRKQEETLSKKSLELEDKEKLLADQIAQLESMRKTAQKQRMLTEQAIEKAVKEYKEATKEYNAANFAKRVLANIESGMRAGNLSFDEAVDAIKTQGLDGVIKHYTPQEHTPNLNHLHEKSLRSDWDDR